MELYNKAEKFVEKSFGKDKLKHFKRTAFWIKKLHPKADEAMLIAAVSHDIERAFRKDADHAKRSKKGFLDKGHLKKHQKQGGKIIFDYLIKQGAGNIFAGRVRKLVERHEIGGDEEQNLLKDADSISFFENNIKNFTNGIAHDLGKRKVKDKLDWMFDRITSKKAKAISKKWYKDAIKKLGY